MKILTLSNCPLIESQGSGYVICGFVNGLRNRGHEVSAYGPDDLILAPALNTARLWRLMLGFFFKGLRLIRQGPPDVLELYRAQAGLLARYLRNRPRRFTVIHHSNGIEMLAGETRQRYLHEKDGPSNIYHRLYNNASRWAFTDVDAIVTVGQLDRDYAIETRLQPPDRVVCIENSLPDVFLNLPLQQNRPRTIGYCGSWISRKGVDTIKKDIPEILRAHKDWNFHLIGVGADFQPNAHFPNDILPRITVIPPITAKEKMVQAYQALSILICPSIYESFGLVMAEAMACGCAIVATRTGFAASLKDGKEAILMADRGSPHLANGLRRLIEDEPLRHDIAANGWQRAQQLRWKPAIDRLESVYSNLASGSKARFA